MTRLRVSAVLLTAIVVAAVAPPAAWAAKDDTLLVSRAAGARGAAGNLGSFNPSISGDGTLAAFDSIATNLHPDDEDDYSDVFVRDIADDGLTLVSRANGARGRAGNETSFFPVISADGRHVAFVSYANNFDPAAGELGSDVYVRDLTTNTTTLVSRASGAKGAGGDSDSHSVAISGDGRYVAFVSNAQNLHPRDPDGAEDVYVRDLKTNTTRLVTQSVLNVPRDDAPSNSPAISADGRHVAFVTGRKDLHPQSTPTEFANDVLVRDLRTDKVELVSRATGAGGAAADDDSGHPSISADGRFVSFNSLGTNLAAADDKRATDVFVRDRTAGTTTLATVIPGVPQIDDAGAEAFGDSISADGRYVTFNTSAPGLYPNGGSLNQFGEPVVDIFVRDMRGGTTKLLSRASGPAGASGNDYSSGSVVSADGRFVAYASSATNLHPDAVAAATGSEDEEPAADIYARDVLGSAGGLDDPRARRSRCPVKGAVISGTEKADVRNGTRRTDVMFGGRGNDVLRGGRGRDCLYGQEGRDRLFGQSSADWLRGGPGSDRLRGGRGSDRLRGQSGADRLVGSSGRDSLTGGEGRDVLFGGSGSDHLTGSERRDWLAGGSGNDRLVGGSGGDRLYGQSGDDRLGDHTGTDRFAGGAGDDHIDARDTTRRGRSRADVVRCGTGAGDVAVVDAIDRVAPDCELVIRG